MDNGQLEGTPGFIDFCQVSICGELATTVGITG